MAPNDDFNEDELGTFDQAKKDARDWVNAKTLGELAIKQKEIEAKKLELEEQGKVLNAWHDVLRFEAIPQKVEEMGLQSPVKLEGIGRVSLTTDVLVSVKAGMKDRLFNWLQEHGMGDLIQPNLNASTLKAWTKGRIKEAKDYPAECLNVTPIEKASILK